MDTERRILSNTAILTLGQAVAQLSNFVFVIVFARHFGAELFGWYSLAMAVGAVASIFVSFGTHQMLVRDLAAQPDLTRERLETALPLHAALAVVIWTALLLAALAIIPDSGIALLIAFVGGYHILLRLVLLLLVPFTARQQMWVPASVDAGERVAAMAVAMGLILAGFGAEWVVVALPLAASLGLVMAYRAVKPLLGPRQRTRPPLRASLALYADAWPFLGILVLNVLYIRTAILLLSGMADQADVGIYAAADRTMMLVGIVHAMFIAATLPAISALVDKQRDAALKVAQRCMRLLIVLSIPASGLLAIFSGEIVQLVFGSDFSAAAPILAALAAATAVKGISSLRAIVAIAAGFQKGVVRSRLIALIVFVSLGALLIELFGPLGLAMAAIVAEAVYALLVGRVLAASGSACPALPLLWKPALAVVLGAAVAMLLRDQHWLIALPITGAVIAAAVIVLGAIRLHDLSYLWRMFRRRAAIPDASGA